LIRNPRPFPPFRAPHSALTRVTAKSAEGWKIVGFYQDPYSDWQAERRDMARRPGWCWTRRSLQALDAAADGRLLHEHSSAAESDIQAEVDRYIAWPAQALKLQARKLEILKLREQAQKELGNRYEHWRISRRDSEWRVRCPWT